ncbi:hypothetical protein H9I45_08245 [Polaribacter haliotis]|uniref:Uncharacterized protein n=1 Tax=Polaribacter haliotis TaxID=1888915 RepID=A0A7L8ABU1_9FLAO|nr:hypothetical protein [Polaribacter haliotis]QOD59367.1 hypothetical protein H9I45_08245 [Polaribacter haliotis]
MFKKAIIEAFHWSMKWYFGSFAVAIATFFFFQKTLDFTTWRSIRYGLAIFTITFIVRAFIQYIQKIDDLEQTVNKKQEKIDVFEKSNSKSDLIKKYNYYGEVLIALKDIFSQINKIKRNENVTKKDISNQLIKLSNRLKSVFEKRFNNNYSISIKVILKEKDIPISENSEIITLIRDEESYFERRDNAKNNNKHIIKDNTCFSEILKNIESPNKAYFFSNNLPKSNNYCNSSEKDYGTMQKNLEEKEKLKYWTLPYKSELVVPISPISYNTNERKNHFFGYLCVDCNEIEGFHKKYDVHNLLGLADGISDLLEQWLILKIKENGE